MHTIGRQSANNCFEATESLILQICACINETGYQIKRLDPMRAASLWVKDAEIVVVVVKIGHRSQVYKDS